MAQNLITRNGQAVHAQIGVTGVPQCKTAPVLAPVDVEAERLAIVERAEVEVRCEGGTLMDQLQAMAEYHAKYVMRPRRRR
jgi:hypothetical protein